MYTRLLVAAPAISRLDWMAVSGTSGGAQGI